MKKVMLIAFTLVSAAAFAAPKSKTLLICTEKSFSPEAAIYRVKQSGKAMTLTKSLAGNSSAVVASENVSDATIKTTNGSTTFSVDRQRSGSATITADVDGNGVVDISLFVASATTLNTHGRLSGFRCTFFK